MIILASASPRRIELLKLLYDDFEVRPSECDETPPDISPTDIAEAIARRKAGAVFCARDNLVIACDTVVLIDGKILGKPQSRDDARAMLKALSGKTQSVISGVCLKSSDKTESFSCVTEVTFYELTDAEIEEYLSTDEPYDKAGAYGIQGKGALFVSKINGDYYNVVGFPVAELKRRIKCFLE